MSNETYSIVKGGKYTFRVKRTIQSYGDKIIGRTYRIGGDYEKCVTVSYKYKDNIPIEASIPHLLYEPECSIGSTLERGGGSEIMIKTLLRHAYSEIPSLPFFVFDDMSKIDCLPKDIAKPPERKILRPLNLAYFSIAYHGKTWYEMRFNAEMKDKERYVKYRDRLQFLTNPADKPDFERFLEIAQPPDEQIEMLQSLYKETETYRDFFNAIPKEKRCNMLYYWLTTFMKYYIGDVYTENDWVMNVNTFDNTPSLGGGYTRRKRTRRVRKQMYRLYDYKESHSF
jgi:hypothetical protein